MLESAGLPIPDHLHGKSLSPILKDPSAEINPLVVSESVGAGGKIGTGHRMIRSMDWKYMIADMNEELLYHLSEDTFEKNNLTNKRLYESEKLQLMEFYQEWKKLAGDKPYPSASK
jgi:arylsulfatase A-like enzyme